MDNPLPKPIVVTEGRLAANKRVLEALPGEMRRLSETVLAVRSINAVHDATIVVRLYHVPSGSEIVLDATGAELRRTIESEGARAALEEVLSDAATRDIAVTLAR
jgi:hypothetical protein